MTSEEDQETSLPFQKQADKLESSGQRGFTQTQILLLIVAVALLMGWAAALQLYDPTVDQDANEDLPKPLSPIEATQTQPELTATLPPQQVAWRDQALEVLEELSPLLEALEQRAVLQWSPEKYEQLIETISTGEEAYSAQRFRDARDTYRDALQQANILMADMPQAFASYSERGIKLIIEKQYAAALEALEVAALIDPGHAPVQTAINTAQQGEAVDRLLTKARFFMGEEQPSEATAALEEAASLDPARADIKTAAKEAARLSRQLAFRGHMRTGHAELDGSKFDDAIAAFNKAVALYPGREEATVALEAAQKQKTDYELSTIRAQAVDAMEQESWSIAESLYRDALALRSGVTFAEAGLQKAVYYRDKQEQVRTLLDDPARLSDQSVAGYSAAIIAELEADTDLPQGLIQAKETLKSQIQAYSRLVPVTLRSDGRSAVSILRGARYRPFRQKSLELKPGTYTLLARREGYRDKRISFKVPLDGQPVTVTIGADEKF